MQRFTFDDRVDHEFHANALTLAVQGFHKPGRSRIVVLASNPCVNDSRIIRAAEAAASAGYDVVVLAPRNSEPRYEVVNDVRYVRLDSSELDARNTLMRTIYDVLFSIIPKPNGYLTKIVRFIVSMAVAAFAYVLQIALGAITSAPGMKPFLRSVRRGASKLKPFLRSVGRGASKLKPFLRSVGRGASKLIGAPKNWLIGLCKSQGLTYFLVRRFDVLFADKTRKLEPDIIHAHDLHTLPAAVKAAAGTDARVIYDSHELECHKNMQSGWLDLCLRQAIERKYIHQSAAVVTVCDSIADHLMRTYSIGRPSVVMNSPIIPAKMSTSPSDIRSDAGLGPREPLAVYIGRITIGRGIEQNVEALCHLPEMHLALLGTAHPATLEQAIELSERLGVRHRLHILAPVPPASLVPYLRTADISVVTIQNVCLSYFYCLPNKLFESVAAGLPCVASDFPEMRRFVEMSKAGVLVDETDPREIAAGMRTAYEKRASLKPRGIQLKALSRVYGWEKQEATLLRLYGDLADEQSRTTNKPPQARDNHISSGPLDHIRGQGTQAVSA